jgi:DNA-binding protein HU-beta|nr:MAG TPA: DNA binding protein [Caudoviricetes sp.]
MKKIELVDELSKVMNVSKKEAAQKINDMNTIVETIAKNMEVGEKTDIGNYITLEKKVQAARQARNPRNPEEVIEIPEKVVLKVKARKTMKNL